MRQNGRHFTDDIFVNEKFCILINISLNFVLEGPIDNKSAVVKIMAWRRMLCTNADPIYWHIYATLGGDELIYRSFIAVSNLHPGSVDINDPSFVMGYGRDTAGEDILLISISHDLMWGYQNIRSKRLKHVWLCDLSTLMSINSACLHKLHQKRYSLYQCL